MAYDWRWHMNIYHCCNYYECNFSFCISTCRTVFLSNCVSNNQKQRKKNMQTSRLAYLFCWQFVVVYFFEIDSFDFFLSLNHFETLIIQLAIHSEFCQFTVTQSIWRFRMLKNKPAVTDVYIHDVRWQIVSTKTAWCRIKRWFFVGYSDQNFSFNSQMLTQLNAVIFTIPNLTNCSRAKSTISMNNWIEARTMHGNWARRN